MADDRTADDVFAEIAKVVPPQMRQPAPTSAGASETRPTIAWDAKGVIPGKPFVLAVPTDHEDLAAYLTHDDLEALLAELLSALASHLQATCQGHVLDHADAEQLGDGRVTGRCVWCDADVVVETDGSVVPVGDRS